MVPVAQWLRLTLIGPAGTLRRLTCPAGGPATQDGTNRGGEEARRLAEVRVGENETFESALRRFNKKIQQSGILAEARRREHYEKPSVKRKRKEAKKRKATSRA
jgi:small subunit ribosomal protein S21